MTTAVAFRDQRAAALKAWRKRGAGASTTAPVGPDGQPVSAKRAAAAARIREGGPIPVKPTLAGDRQTLSARDRRRIATALADGDRLTIDSRTHANPNSADVVVEVRGQRAAVVRDASVGLADRSARADRHLVDAAGTLSAQEAVRRARRWEPTGDGSRLVLADGADVTERAAPRTSLPSRTRRKSALARRFSGPKILRGADTLFVVEGPATFLRDQSAAAHKAWDKRGRGARGVSLTGPAGPGGDGPVPRNHEGEIVAGARARELARPIYERSVALEPEITERVTGLAASQGGTMYGLKYRLKAEGGIATKIERVRDEDNVGYADAAASVKDTVRYTMHFDEGDFGASAQHVVDALRADNAGVKVSNTWAADDVAYKGVNLSVTRHDGFRYEVQVHTAESQRVKDEMHGLYEAQRVLPKGSPRWQALEDEMRALSRGLTSRNFPAGARSVFRLVAPAVVPVATPDAPRDNRAVRVCLPRGVP